jgi:superfamily II DNA or RNA helicase
MLESQGTKAMIIDSSVSSKKRQEILNQWGIEFYPLLSVHTLEIGFDIPKVRIEIILATTSNMNQVIQRIGRVIRKHEGKDLALIYVIYVADTKDDNIHDVVKKAIQTDPRKLKEEEKEHISESNNMEPLERTIFNNNNNNKNSKNLKNQVEGKRLEKAYNIIESTLYEPMIVELKEEEGQYRNKSEENHNRNQKEKKRLFKVKSSNKEENIYYEVDIENKTCTCPDFNFKLNKCKHIVAIELFLF